MKIDAATPASPTALTLTIGEYAPALVIVLETMRADQALDLDHSTRLVDNPFSIGDRITHAKCNRGRRVA